MSSRPSDNWKASPQSGEKITPELETFANLAYACRKFVMKNPEVNVKELFDQTYALVVNGNFDDSYEMPTWKQALIIVEVLSLLPGNRYSSAIKMVISSYPDEELKAMMKMVMMEQNNLALHINWMKERWELLGQVAMSLAQQSPISIVAKSKTKATTMTKTKSKTPSPPKSVKTPTPAMVKLTISESDLPEPTPIMEGESEESSEENGGEALVEMPLSPPRSPKTMATSPSKMSPTRPPISGVKGSFPNNLKSLRS